MRRLGDACEPKLPTYRTVAAVVEGQHGAGLALVGWTAARSVLIAVPMIAVGVDGRRAIMGSLLASVLISMLALGRVKEAAQKANLP